MNPIVQDCKSLSHNVHFNTPLADPLKKAFLLFTQCTRAHGVYTFERQLLNAILIAMSHSFTSQNQLSRIGHLGGSSQYGNDWILKMCIVARLSS